MEDEEKEIEETQSAEKQNSLLEKLSGSRDKLEAYVSELELLKCKVDELFPKEKGVQNYRSKWVFEEKVKTSTAFFDSLLKLRQEINKTIKDEIELRRKLLGKDGEEIEDDIRGLADEIQSMEENDQEEKDQDK